MSWDAGAISNFGALTFPTDSSGGGGAVSPNLVVSTLTATNYVSTSTINTTNITMSNQALPYVFAGFDDIGSTSKVIVLPFSFATTDYAIITQYTSTSALQAITDNFQVVGYADSVSSFTLITNNNSGENYPVQYLAVGQLPAVPPP
jgi:hypothetical protein